MTTTIQLESARLDRARKEKAASILYRWACDEIDTEQCKSQVSGLGYDIDFRQADAGAFMEAFDRITQRWTRIPV